MQAGGSTDPRGRFSCGAWRTISPRGPALPGGRPPTNDRLAETPRALRVARRNQKFHHPDDRWLQTRGRVIPTAPFLSTYEAFRLLRETNRNRLLWRTANNAGYTLATDGDELPVPARQRGRSKLAPMPRPRGVHGLYRRAFTVASDPIDAQGINLLKSCATSSADYFQASDGNRHRRGLPADRAKTFKA